MIFEEYKKLVLEESKKLGTIIPIKILKKSDVVNDYGNELLKKYPKFLTVRNMVSAIIHDKWLVRCPICGKMENYNQCIRRAPKPTCGSPLCKIEATKRTSMERYGSSTYINSKEMIDKRRKNGWVVWNNGLERKDNPRCINKYKEIKKRLEENHLSGIDTFDDYKGIVDKETKVHIKYTFTCDKCGMKFKGTLHSRDFPFCRNCHPKQYRSVQFIKDETCVTKFIRSSVDERELGDFCESLGLEVLYNHKGLIGDTNKEVDIYLPQINVAIEYNGLYWHSSKFAKRYEHKQKTDECEKNGVRLIHVFEDEWKFKKQIVKNRLKSILGKQNKRIFARKCIVREVDTDIAKKFVNKYHIQGYVQSNIKLGLFYKNRLVAVMTFGHPRFNKNYEWELLRFATIGSFRIIGAAGKLFNYFRKNNNGSIISYSDRRWGNGEVYQKLGMNKIGMSEPNYYYINHDRRYSRYMFQKHKLKDKLSVYDESLSEVENMKNNGFYQIWDCGNNVFSII